MIQKEYLELFTTPARSIKGKAELFISSALAQTFSYNDFLKEIKIERVAENGKFFGFGVSQKATIQIKDKDRQFNINTDNTIKTLFSIGDKEFINNFPTFYIDDISRDENTNDITITAYDAINKCGKHTVAELGFTALDEEGNTIIYTINDYLIAVAEVMGVNISYVNIDKAAFDLFYIGGANFDGTEKLREVLDDAAEITQTIYYIVNDTLIFRKLATDDNADYCITKSGYFELTSEESRTLTEIVSATELGDNIKATTGNKGEVQYIRNNAFLDLREDRVYLLEEALNDIGGISINEFTCKWRGNYLLNIGDKLNITTKDYKIITTYLLNDEIVYNGGFSQTSNWSFKADERETAENPTNLGEALKQTFAKVDKANKQVEIVVDEVAKLKLTTEGITASVQKTNKEVSEMASKVDATITADDLTIEVQKQLQDAELNSITTSTGFTFNEVGLKISKDGIPIETQITEDGMEIFKNDEVLLTANNTGVHATNLTANTYLIVGINSRFENYNNGSRTGCFWIA